MSSSCVRPLYFADLPYDLDFVRKALVTNEKNEQKITGLTIPQKFLNDFIVEHLDSLTTPDKIDNLVKSRVVYALYKEWCRHNSVSKVLREGVLNTVFEQEGFLEKPIDRMYQSERGTWFTIKKEDVLKAYRTYLKMPTFEFQPAGTL